MDQPFERAAGRIRVPSKYCVSSPGRAGARADVGPAGSLTTYLPRLAGFGRSPPVPTGPDETGPCPRFRSSEAVFGWCGG